MIDLRSDTCSRPTQGMRQATADAAVGDDVTAAIRRGLYRAAAAMAGMLEEVTEVLFQDNWQRTPKMDDVEVLRRSLEGAGLPAHQLLTASEARRSRRACWRKRRPRTTAGAFGIPSFLVTHELYFSKDRLSEVEDTIAGGRAADPETREGGAHHG